MRGSALNRPNLIARVVSLVAMAAAVVVVVVLVSGGSSYILRLTMANASGLRPGSQVLLGGVPIGTVGTINMNRAGTAVVAELDLEPGKVHVGQGVRASVIAANLLGEKYVQLAPGNRNQPLASGTTIPEASTTVPTDLDQVVDVLNQPTRVDFALMLREAGVAVAGRKADVHAILAQLPTSLQAATRLLRGLVTDNHTLGDFISNSNSFIARVDANGPQLQRLLTSAGGAAKTFADKASSLKSLVQQGPEFFARLRTYFDAVTISINHLNPVAAQLAHSTGPLDAVLKEVRPFAQAAIPTLNRATQVAPSLSSLAVQATPTLRAAVPTVSSLSHLAQLSQPLSTWLGLSSSDLFSIFDGWSHAIQFRDGISHIFNGDLYLNPQIVLNAANTGATPAQKARNLLGLAPAIVQQLGLQGAVARARALLAGLAAHRASSAPAPKATSAAPKPSASSVTAQPSTPTGSGSRPGSGAGAGSGAGLAALGSGINHLLGGVLGVLGGKGHGSSGSSASTNSTGTTGASGHAGSGLAGLLGYLLGK
jgi:phospholipid/cholesterol/gamma-HCH transport system substrate-binding protein